MTLIVDVSLTKMFPALLTAVCDALDNLSCTVRTSVPSILSSGRKVIATSEVGVAENVKSIILLLHPVAVKSIKSVERKCYNQSLALLKTVA